MQINSGIVTTEGDNLYYKVRGQGRPILFIAPGGGNGDDYMLVANLLAESYKVITYDRRANGRSTRNFPHDFSVRQQSRDAVAILKYLNESKAFVVGNSSGAVIALDMATAFPEHVHAAVIHEAPISSVLPDAEKWKDFFASCNQLAKDKGSSAGAKKFLFGIEMPTYRLLWATIKLRLFTKKEKLEHEPERMSGKDATDVLLLNELLPVTTYEPDFDIVKASGVRLYIGCSQYGLKRDVWYARVARILAEKLSCKLVEFPGHHGSHMDKPKEWSDVVKKIAREAGW